MCLTEVDTPGREALRPNVALGVCVGTRAMGIAIATREHLVRAHTVTLHRLPPASRAEYVIGVLWRLAQDYGASRLALVDVAAPRTDRFVRQLWRWPVRVVRLGAVVATRYTAEEVRASHVEAGLRPTNRALGASLAERFPEIAVRLRLGDPKTALPSWWTRAPVRTDRERYVLRMLLALGGALHDLDQEVIARLVL